MFICVFVCTVFTVVMFQCVELTLRQIWQVFIYTGCVYTCVWGRCVCERESLRVFVFVCVFASRAVVVCLFVELTLRQTGQVFIYTVCVCMCLCWRDVCVCVCV